GPHDQAHPPPRRLLRQVRLQRRRPDPGGREPQGHPHLRPRRPRAARPELHEDRVPRLGGGLTWPVTCARATPSSSPPAATRGRSARLSASSPTATAPATSA